MPRAFLITNRRYKTVVEYDSRDNSPDRKLDPLKPSNSIEVPKNPLYQAFYSGFHSLSNLEQLAEISLATAHRWHLSPPSSPEAGPGHPHTLMAPEDAHQPLCLSHPSNHPRVISDGNASPDERSSPSSCSSGGSNSSSPTDMDGDFLSRGHHHHHHHPVCSHRHYPCRRPASSPGRPAADDDDNLSEAGDDLTMDYDSSSGGGNSNGLWGPDDLLHPGGGIGENNLCPECGKRYSTSSNLARHRQTHRSMSDKKARKCPHCDKVYVSMPAYSMHVRTHDPVGCQCPFCGKCFSRPWLLQGHIRTHTGEKPFKCHVCGKAFADKSNLRAHIQTHSDTKPYVCQRCGKAFALKSYLYKHEESSCMRSHGSSSSTGRLVDNKDIATKDTCIAAEN